MDESSHVAKVNKTEFKRKLGHKFAARILALMDGVNRLNALWDFMLLNKETDEDSVRRYRNEFEAFALSMGIATCFAMPGYANSNFADPNADIRSLIEGLVGGDNTDVSSLLDDLVDALGQGGLASEDLAELIDSAGNGLGINAIKQV